MTTKEYIKAHISRVTKHLNLFILLLAHRAYEHDQTKLGPRELPLWEKMDEEPRYPYGSPEYFDKIQRNQEVFKRHYAANRHHPEHYINGIRDMTLVDITEMLCDWLGYKDNISYKEATKIVSEQMLKYGIITKAEYDQTIDDKYIMSNEDPNILKVILLNTLKRYFAVLGGGEGVPDGVAEELTNTSDITKNPYIKQTQEPKIDLLI